MMSRESGHTSWTDADDDRGHSRTRDDDCDEPIEFGVERARYPTRTVFGVIAGGVAVLLLFVGLTVVLPRLFHVKASNVALLLGMVLLWVGVLILMLWRRDEERSARGIETRDYGSPWGQPGVLSETKNQTLTERLESGSKRRRVGVLALLVMANGLVIAWILAGGRTSGELNLWLEIAVTVVFIALFGPGALLRRRNEADEDAVGAKRVPYGSMPQAEAALADMALASGANTPELYVIDACSLNACVARDGGVCVTRGLLEALSPRELRAVFAWLLARQFDPDRVGSEISAFSSEGAQVTDAEALRLLRDPVAMLDAWRRVLGAENRVPGSLKLSAARFLVPPGESADWRRSRLAQLTQLAGAMAATTADAPDASAARG